jgi:cytochrome c oxidase subunit 2
MNNMREPRHIVRVTIIWAVVTVIAAAVFLVIGPQLTAWNVLPPIASERAAETDQVLGLFTFLAIPVFMLVIVFAGYSVMVFRSSGRPDRDGPSMRGNQRIQFTWVAVSLVLVAFLVGYGFYYLDKVQAAPTGDVLQVNVTGEQWLWNYSYPQYGNVSTTTLELPVGRPVEFTINSIDVQHSFWIPALSIKQDAVPGETTHISVTPNVTGDYAVRCAELCGIYHAYMDSPVHVVSESDFVSWISQEQQAQSSSAFLPTGGLPEFALVGDAGRRSFAA